MCFFRCISLVSFFEYSFIYSGEEGGITQQIGATLIPVHLHLSPCLPLRPSLTSQKAEVESKIATLNSYTNFNILLPGLVFIDTPGHESFRSPPFHALYSPFCLVSSPPTHPHTHIHLPFSLSPTSPSHTHTPLRKIYIYISPLSPSNSLTPSRSPLIQSNMRVRGSSLCDFAILTVEITSGLQGQSIESIKLLRKGRTRFVVALNKVPISSALLPLPYLSLSPSFPSTPLSFSSFSRSLSTSPLPPSPSHHSQIDRINGWVTHPHMGFRSSFEKQSEETKEHFHTRLKIVRCLKIDFSSLSSHLSFYHSHTSVPSAHRVTGRSGKS